MVRTAYVVNRIEENTMQNSVVEGLRHLLGDTYVLYVKTHGFHWNVRGPNFHSLHAMFMEQYTAMWQSLDDIAERLRALGADAPGSSNALASASTITEEGDHVPGANDMLKTLVADHGIWLETANTVLAAASEAGDTGTEDLLTPLIADHEKTMWMLKSSIG